MPWRGPEVPGEFPTLGNLIADWIEAFCVIPDGDHQGEPYLLTAEMVRFLQWFYRLDPDTGLFVYERGGQLVRPQKWGKGPFSAALICAESVAPVRFDGWDARGEPVGRPWATPWIQVAGVSEDQTDNVWRALVPMIILGPLADIISDTGETRINLPGRGLIEPVTFAAPSRLGQRITFAVQDETHAWTKHNGGLKVADTQRRNLAGTSGRFLETTNAWDPREQSVAQRTAASKTATVYRDDIDPGVGSIRNKRERRRMLRVVYGDSWWVNLDRIEGEIDALLEHDPPQAERFFLNRKQASEDAAFDADRWKQLAAPRQIDDGEMIVIGVDGARFRDALAIIATHIESGYQWPLGIWERPEDAGDDYEHPLDEADRIVADAFDRWDVWRLYADPQWIDALIDRWQGRWGERIICWYTNRTKPTAYALRQYRIAQVAGETSHDGDVKFAQHIANARRQKTNVIDDDGKPMWLIAKDHPSSPLKIDAAMAGCLSWEARGDAIAAGVDGGPSIYETQGIRVV